MKFMIYKGHKVLVYAYIDVKKIWVKKWACVYSIDTSPVFSHMGN